MRGNYRIFLVYFSILFIGVAGYFIFVYFTYDDVGDKIPYEHFTKKPELISQIQNSESETESTPQIEPESKPESMPEIEPQTAPQIAEESEPQIAPESESTIKSSRVYIINVNIANIRERPSTDSKIIGQFLQDAVITITRTENGWGEVEGGGFVFMELLRE